MKTRLGFISNSSSSSFVIMGIKTNEETVKEILGIDKEYDDIWDYEGKDGKFDVIYDSENDLYYIGFALLNCGEEFRCKTQVFTVKDFDNLKYKFEINQYISLKTYDDIKIYIGEVE